MMRKIGQCTARGPYHEHCTEQAGHRYAHYDASKDTAWTDNIEDHRDGCECDMHRPDLYEDEGISDGQRTEGEMMSEQQKFQPGDRVKVTMELTVLEHHGHINRCTIRASTVERWVNELDHIDVELIERPMFPGEPGWYLCSYGNTPRAMRWDGKLWHWNGEEMPITLQDKVTVIGTVTLNEGVEL